MAEKSILITGCSSGIGLAAALLLKKRGYRVFASARKAEDVAKLEVQGLESVKLDVNDRASMDEALKKILQKTNGTLYALFNNAGFGISSAVEDLTREIDRAQFETNVFGAMELTRLVLPVMRKQGYGRIIQNSSMLGYVTIPFYGVYAASKHALEGYSNTLRQELRGTNIYVCILNPGPIKSDFRKNAYDQYQHTIKKHQTGLHKETYAKFEQSYFSSQDSNAKLSQDPKIVVDNLIHALEKRRPKAHYYIGMPAKLFAVLKWILPESSLDWIVAKIR